MTDALCESLRANADLTDKAVEFMSDPEQIEEAKADIALWRAAADEIESLQRVVDGYSNALADRGASVSDDRALCEFLRSLLENRSWRSPGGNSRVTHAEVRDVEKKP